MTEDAGDEVLVADEGAVRILALNRPERLNAFTARSYGLLAELLAEADAEPGVHVIVIEGLGRAFSSGVDLKELESDDRRQLAASFDGLIGELAGLDTPLIAAVHGAAVGFGATILLHCDLVVADAEARFRFPFASLGTTPEAASAALLPRLVGPQRAAELLLTGRWVDASEAVAIGLAIESVPAGRAGVAAREVALSIAALAPQAVRSARRLLREGRVELVARALELERSEAARLSAEIGPMRPPS